MIAAPALKNPYPGLRPFTKEETHLFFGRESQIDALLERLGRQRLLAVVGESGAGKSSLVKAGLIPALEGGDLAVAGAAWRTAVFQPGHDPFQRLAESLHGALPGMPADRETALGILKATLRRSRRGLAEAVLESRCSENLLLVADQFEEVFTQRRAAVEQREISEAEARDEYAAFVALLLEAARDWDARVYVVLTMRSDYLGSCPEFRGLPEALNDAQYLVPRLTRDEMRLAIEGPARVGGRRIPAERVEQLLNEVIDDQDQLPVLQHALMRTWTLGRHVPMETALSDHADEALAGMSDEQRRLTRVMFQCLVEQDEKGRQARRPSPIARIARVAGVSEEAVRAAVPGGWADVRL